MTSRHATTRAGACRAAGRLRGAALGVLLSLALGGCERPSAQPSSSRASAISQTYTVGARDQRPEVEVRLTADRDRMTVAERLTLIITIDAAAGANVLWTPPRPAPAGEAPALLGDFIIAASTQGAFPESSPGRVITEHTLVLEPFLEGPKTVPAMIFPVRSAAGGELAITTEAITVQVAAVVPPEEAEQAQLAPARDALRPTLPAAAGDPVVAAVASVLVASWLGAFVWAGATAKRARRQPDPLELASARLAAVRPRLEAARNDAFSPAAGDLGALAAELAGSLRQYLQHRWGVAAVGATAAELPARLAGSGLPAELHQAAADSLAALERWAFAPEHPRTADLEPHVLLAEQVLAAGAAATPARAPRALRGAAA